MIGVPGPKTRAGPDAQRRTDAHRSGAETPRAFATLTACRARSAVARAYPQSARAYPMASIVYRSPRATPRGTTTSTAPHPRHRYRRVSTVVEPGAQSGSSGPSTSRLRSPWPTTVNERPGSRLAAPQPGQLAGRTAEHDGGATAQNLTSIADWMIRVPLRGIACNCLLRSAAGERCANTARHPFVRAPCPGVFSGPDLYDVGREPGQKRAGSVPATGSA